MKVVTEKGYTGHEKCCLCGGPLWDGKKDYWKGGNNADPLGDPKRNDRCCDACNEIVIEARMAPRVLAAEITRVSTAIANMTNYSTVMARKAALAAICASRGPVLLAEKERAFAQLKEQTDGASA